jgi:hypothetical protein
LHSADCPGEPTLIRSMHPLRLRLLKRFPLNLANAQLDVPCKFQRTTIVTDPEKYHIPLGSTTGAGKREETAPFPCGACRLQTFYMGHRWTRMLILLRRKLASEQDEDSRRNGKDCHQ